MEIERVYELPNYLKRQFSWYKTNTLWRVIYKNIITLTIGQ